MFPHTIRTAIVSPKALDRARTTAAIIPENDFLRITFLTVCHLVAPIDNEASVISTGMERNTSTIMLIRRGIIITASTTPPAKRV